jgi:hypothetical protein
MIDESFEGWYTDPYQRHDDRWVSKGVPTRLVCDLGIEGDDPVEPGPFNVIPVRSGNGSVAFRDASDLYRADDLSPGNLDEPPFKLRTAGLLFISAAFVVVLVGEGVARLVKVRLSTAIMLTIIALGIVTLAVVTIRARSRNR